jgi:hypothetical protein
MLIVHKYTSSELLPGTCSLAITNCKDDMRLTENLVNVSVTLPSGFSEIEPAIWANS